MRTRLLLWMTGRFPHDSNAAAKTSSLVQRPARRLVVGTTTSTAPPSGARSDPETRSRNYAPLATAAGAAAAAARKMERRAGAGRSSRPLFPLLDDLPRLPYSFSSFVFGLDVCFRTLKGGKHSFASDRCCRARNVQVTGNISLGGDTFKIGARVYAKSSLIVNAEVC